MALEPAPAASSTATLARGRRLGVLGIVVAAVVSMLVAGRACRGRDEGARCGPGFTAAGARCLPRASCDAPLTARGTGCTDSAARVFVPAATVVVGPSDWEAEGRVPPRTLHVAPFLLDAFEMTCARAAAATGAARVLAPGDGARALSGVTRAEAADLCRRVGGRLPTEDEWMVAASSGARQPPRYPWGDTGAVCRRAAWGLDLGPCARGADGPDTVGAHPDGDSLLGLHDLAGNVAEWVAAAHGGTDTGVDEGVGVTKGGSWQSALASDLRVWARLELPPGVRDPRVGLRCAYAP